MGITLLVLALQIMLSMSGRGLCIAIWIAVKRAITGRGARSGEGGGTPAEVGTAMTVSEYEDGIMRCLS